MKTPITYYGGKISMAEMIIKNIPPHKTYVENFAGGLAVFFAKEKSKLEVINDLNSEVTNFYRTLKNVEDFNNLKDEIDSTLYSRKTFNDAKVVYENPHLFCKIKRAWALWSLSTHSINSSLGVGWGRDKTIEKKVRNFNNKQENFKDILVDRLKSVQIEERDAML